jgi:hypothetical protein
VVCICQRNGICINTHLKHVIAERKHCYWKRLGRSREWASAFFVIPRLNRGIQVNKDAPQGGAQYYLDRAVKPRDDKEEKGYDKQLLCLLFMHLLPYYSPNTVIPAKAGIQCMIIAKCAAFFACAAVIHAFAGMTMGIFG